MTDNLATVYSNTQTDTSYFQAFLNKIFFHHISVRKVRTVRPAGEKQPTLFSTILRSSCTDRIFQEKLP